MNKRLKLQCWNCPKAFFSPVEITVEQEIIVSCPYCRAEAVVNLKPYRKKNTMVMKHIDLHNISNDDDQEFQFPDVIPTKKSQNKP
jgi:hypothetical protein